MRGKRTNKRKNKRIITIHKKRKIRPVKTRKNIRRRKHYIARSKLYKGGFNYNKIDCDSIEVKSEANRFFKMKCYLAKKNITSFEQMVSELIGQYNTLNSIALVSGDKKAYQQIPFMNYIDKNYDTFSDASKAVVRKIYTRFQEEALPTMKYVH